ncbi:MAG TPA: class I SAM-dependent methyltransferase [Dehalococcoidia bacterium]|nr:class I SAM-dependent methyltransferase [Dehalococcoidia bacterium]
MQLTTARQELRIQTMTQNHNSRKINLEWNDDDVVPAVVYPNLDFLFQQMLHLTLKEVTAGHGELILDVGCGRAIDGAHLWKKGAQVVGLEPSRVMIARAKEHLISSNARVALAQGIGENLPFKSHSFDKVMCKGALDHFFSPSQTMDEIARVLKPGGEMIVSIANFNSLGFRLGKRLYPLTKFLAPSLAKERQPWELPLDHKYKFDYPFLSSLVKQHFDVKRAKGISLFFGLPLWGSFLSRLPHSVSYALLKVLDRLARPLPSLADVILMTCTPIDTPR